MGEEQRSKALFDESVAIMARLRGPSGCPWDREQTPDTIRKYTLEETYEVLDAIERQDWPNLCEELGDLLLQVLFYAQMAAEAGHFNISDVLAGLNRKLIRRHPHVFGEEASIAAGNRATGLAGVDPGSANGAGAVLANWARIKQLEQLERKPGSSQATGFLGGVLRAQSALGEASKLGSAAARAGFDWPDAGGLIAKIREEACEVEAELPVATSANALAEEVGDLLFTSANLARHLKVDPEMALRDASAKFRRRFAAMEQESTRPLEELSAQELDQAWQRAKQSTALFPLAEGGL